MSTTASDVRSSPAREWQASQIATRDLLAPYGLRLGINPLGWTNDVITEFGDDTSAETFIAEAAACGYEGVEMGRKFPTEPAAVGRLLAEGGVDLVSGWYSGRLGEISVAEELKNVARHARVLAENGARVLVYGETGLMPGDDPLNEPLSATPVVPDREWPGYGQRLTEFAEALEDDYGIRLAYHAHLMMVAESEAEIDRLMAETGDSVGLLFDTGHIVAGGGDLGRVLANHGHRINHIHLKDIRRDVFAGIRERDESFNTGVRAGMFTVPGDGTIDYAPVIDFAKSEAYNGWLVVEAEQDPAQAPSVEYADKAMRTVRSFFGG
ncbi:myo-inosose-2 dehydratase [Salinisphaera sp. LB1]|uniref:myo-inosose-2 dehydratase n=1 Tax=Salinisphaera sp. LB1 TaxID=2183911 RepID=UPI000D7068E4|nr:myo-inosose-2 dehydratase [Salinisphaera sp. LB1]AWN17856.1 Inosose dehydratase [Salinisphaera sp. LB1]